MHYSKFHLHWIFTKTVGLTLHDYMSRRQLTEAAKLLVFSKKPIIEIALISGYESQQAFTGSFKAMYKTTPAKFREAEEFYPLQLEIHLKEEPVNMNCTKDDIQFAVPADLDDWMELVNLSIDGYPCLNEAEYIDLLQQYIADKKALILRDEGMAIGVMGFSADTGSIDFLAVHPQYRSLGITKLFLDKLVDELLCGKEISLTTYRAGDKADTIFVARYVDTNALSSINIVCPVINIIVGLGTMLATGGSAIVAKKMGNRKAAISFLRTFGFMMASLLVLPIFLQETGVWLAIPVSEILTLILGAGLLRLLVLCLHYFFLPPCL